jgi:hypothetical protein
MVGTLSALPASLAILPEGTVRDEGTFILLVSLLAAFIGAAVFLRLRKRRGE